MSQQLALLEREAGVPLLERDGRRVTLTPAAHRLVARTRRIIDELDAAAAELDEERTTVDGEVRIGAFPSAVLGLVVPAAVTLTARYPGISLSIRETDPGDGADLLRSGALDILVGYEYDLVTAVPDGGMEHVPLLDDPLLVGMPSSHPLAARPSIDLAELAEEGWVAGLPGTTFGGLLQRACRAAGFEPRITHRSREFAVQQALVAAELGAALLPGLACTSRRPDVRYLPVRSPALTRHIDALLRHGSRGRPAVGVSVDELAGLA